jgi:NTE family protein
LATGEKVVLASGSMAEAMRASMAVPGVFTPYQIGERSLVDGGLSSNLPIDTARAMGADIVIAVDVRPELKSADELGSAIAVTNQMLDILIQRETLEQVRALGAGDIYVRMDLPEAGSADFAGAVGNIPIGYEEGLRHAGKLGRLSVPNEQFRSYLAAQRVPRSSGIEISFLEFPGASGVVRQSIERQISFAAEEPVELWRLQQELLGMEGFRNTEIVDFRVIEEEGRYGLVLETARRSRGPNYVNVGFDFDYSSSGETDANLLLSFRMTELNRRGAEWETFLSVGDLTRVFSELYQPIEPSRRLFIAGSVLYSNEFINALDAADHRLGFRLQEIEAGLDLGVRLGQAGEARIGYTRGFSRIGRALGLPANASADWFDRSEVRAAVTIDTLDRANFPTTGIFATSAVMAAMEELGADDNYSRLQAQLYKPITFGRNTVVPRFLADIRLSGGELPIYDRASLGGFLQLSGYSRAGLYDQNAVLAELIYYRELAKLPAAFGGGVYAGVSVEVGDVWSDLDDFDGGSLKYGGSVFLGADTIVGPLYLGIGAANGGDGAVYLQLAPVLRTSRQLR